MFDLKEYKSNLAALVNIDSGSYDEEGVTSVCQRLTELYKGIDYKIEWFDTTDGPKAKAFIAYKDSYDELDVLFLCHTDTVFDKGEAAKRPYTESADGLKGFGPGVSDMKSGCLMAYYAAKALKDENLPGKYAFLYNPQEEIGSIGTRELIEKLSKQSKVVIALEPARSNGACLNQRKGIGRYTITFKGKKAHAGVNPQDGASAIVEMAHWICYLDTLNDYDKGISVNSGVVSGGSVANIVADHAELKIDVRMTDLNDGIEVERLIFEKLNHKVNDKIEVTITGKITRPPMKPDAKTLELCDKISKLGEQRGFKVNWGFSGGGSDASFASGLGITSLDGMGPRGGGFHSNDEFIDYSDITERFNLLVDTIKMLAGN